MPQKSLSLTAGWTRAIFAVIGLALFPVILPGFEKHRPLFVGYLAIALLIQLAIHRQIGGNVRVILGGLVDVAVLTYFVHRMGSGTTPIISLYFMIGILNALAVGLRQAYVLAAIALAAFISMIVAEQQGILPYAPDAPSWGRSQPDFPSALVTAVLTGLLMFLSTAIVGILVEQVRAREKELLRANVLLEELSQKDPLTQLYNRRHLMSRIEHELARVRRGHPMVLVMIDLDGFKRVNDELGHLAGDDVLRSVADALGACTRATDVAGRYGGDEFLVLLTDTELAQAERVAERLVTAVAGAAARVEAPHHVTASIGLAAARHDDRVVTLLRRADEQCYAAKQAGGDRTSVAALEVSPARS